MKLGLNEAEYTKLEEEVLKPLKAYGARIFAFGSRARGDHRAHSDIDIMVVSDEDLSRPISQIREKMEKSNFPYKVDIVSYSEFANSFKENYEIDKIEI